MRKRHIFYALLFIMAGVQTSWAQGVMIWMNGESEYLEFSEVDSLTFFDDVLEAIDLGLPSGTLWASCNVGASRPEDFGDYFAWGEVNPKDDYSWSSYRYLNDLDDTMLKYNTNSECGTLDYRISLEAGDDAATMNWDNEWQMPNHKQFEELVSGRYTDLEWTTQNDIEGWLITSKSNGNSIFLPAAGYRQFTDLVNVGTPYYWTRSSSTYCGGGVAFTKDKTIGMGGLGSMGTFTDRERFYGMSVRPVRKPDYTLISEISLSETEIVLYLGETKEIYAVILPIDAYNPSIYWATRNSEVATVTYDASGGGSGTFDPTGAPTGNFATITAVAGGECDIICRAEDGSDVFAVCHVTVKGYYNSDGYVDLALPSGTLWATCNVGADRPQEYGDYFAWGETEPKESFGWTNYKWMSEARDDFRYINKYTFPDNETEGHWYSNGTFVGDNLTELEPGDDAATIQRGREWQTPSRAQFEELTNVLYTTVEWTQMNGVNGIKITSNENGKSVFLPAAGLSPENGVPTFDGMLGDYWSRTLRLDWSGMAYKLSLFDTSQMDDVDVPFEMYEGYRYTGSPIRPVRVKEEVEHEYVDLGLPSGTLWAICNIGADNPEDGGDFFAWGETTPKRDYTWETYKYCEGSNNSLTKYNTMYHIYDFPYPTNIGYNGFTDDLMQLLPGDDAATINWGSEWQTPDEQQLNELLFNHNDNVSRKKMIKNSVEGVLITSTVNGNTLFLPAVGFCTGGERYSYGGYYWSRNLYYEPEYGYYLCDEASTCSFEFDDDDVTPSQDYPFYEYDHSHRCKGLPIRPVRRKR